MTVLPTLVYKSMQYNENVNKTSPVFVELGKVMPKSVLLRKRPRTGLIREKQGREMCPVRHYCLHILAFKPCGVFVNMCSLIDNL